MNYLQSFLCLVATIATFLSTANAVENFTAIVLKDTGWSEAQKESQSKFECPRNQVMIGRKHDGGVSGNTMYKCALVYNDGNEFGVSGDAWSDWTKESYFTYICPVDKVMTGREHRGGEDGKTKYKCSSVRNLRVSISYTSHHWTEEIKESNSQYVCPKNQVMTGRAHFKDENGKIKTEYKCATLKPLYPDTVSLRDMYKGESRGCVWQDKSLRRCPPYVIYCDQKVRHSLALTVNQNEVFTSQNVEFDTSLADVSHSDKPAAIFTMGVFGDIYASTKHPVFLFHHSSFFAGSPVASAGEIMADGGKITKITSCSGHYWPRDYITKQAIDALKRQGYTGKIPFQSCVLLHHDYMILKSGDKIPPAELYFTKHDSALLGPGKTVVCQRLGMRRDFCRRPIFLKVPRFITIKLCFQNGKCKMFKEGEHRLRDGVLNLADMKVSAHRK